MTAIMSDINNNDQHHLIAHRVRGQSFNEILYADDTILISISTQAVNRHIKAIQIESAINGLYLNCDKCEVLEFGRCHNVKFMDGTPLKQAWEVKYLGSRLNIKGAVHLELQQRLQADHSTWKRLERIWKHQHISIKRKINIWNAIIRSKLMYGLESAALNISSLKALDSFQAKGFRQILKLSSTHAQKLFNIPPTHSNAYDLKAAPG